MRRAEPRPTLTMPIDLPLRAVPWQRVTAGRHQREARRARCTTRHQTVATTVNESLPPTRARHHEQRPLYQRSTQGHAGRRADAHASHLGACAGDGTGDSRGGALRADVHHEARRDLWRPTDLVHRHGEADDPSRFRRRSRGQLCHILLRARRRARQGQSPGDLWFRRWPQQCVERVPHAHSWTEAHHGSGAGARGGRSTTG